MNKREYELLKHVETGALKDWTKLPPADRGLMRVMEGKNWFALLGGYGDVKISDTGIAALRAYEDQLEHEAQQRAEKDAAARAERAYLDQQTEKQFRHDWRIAVFELLGGFVLGLVTQYFVDIVGYATRLWSALFH